MCAVAISKLLNKRSVHDPFRLIVDLLNIFKYYIEMSGIWDKNAIQSGLAGSQAVP
jgi:hypothetical protein